MLRTEGESQMRQVSVGIYGDADDGDFELKLAAIEAFLLTHGGSCEIDRSAVPGKVGELVVTFRASIPKWFTNLHHGFDSKLNSTTSGFGVAWVEDAN